MANINTPLMSVPVITLDGVGGAGKSTLSRLLAKALEWHFLDSGALYRVLALCAVQHHVNEKDAQTLETLARHLDVQFVTKENEGLVQIILEGHDVTCAIRSPDCGNAASRISGYGGVRSGLLDRQRIFRQPPGLIADGRDMGTVVFPDANFKIFLTANAETRALRRYTELQAKSINVSLSAVLAELLERDKRDIEREIAPLKPAQDAWILDTTLLTIEEAFSCMIQEVHKRGF